MRKIIKNISLFGQIAQERWSACSRVHIALWSTSYMESKSIIYHVYIYTEMLLDKVGKTVFYSIQYNRLTFLLCLQNLQNWLISTTFYCHILTLWRRRLLSHRNQSIDLLCKSDGFYMITPSSFKGLRSKDVLQLWNKSSEKCKPFSKNWRIVF